MSCGNVGFRPSHGTMVKSPPRTAYAAGSLHQKLGLVVNPDLYKVLQVLPIALVGKASSLRGTDDSRRVTSKASRFAGRGSAGRVIRIGLMSAADSAVSPSSCTAL